MVITPSSIATVVSATLIPVPITVTVTSLSVPLHPALAVIMAGALRDLHNKIRRMPAAMTSRIIQTRYGHSSRPGCSSGVSNPAATIGVGVPAATTAVSTGTGVEAGVIVGATFIACGYVPSPPPW